MNELAHGATPDFLTELHAAVAEQTIAIDTLARAIREANPPAWPFRDAAITNSVRLVANGPVKVTYVHATNELGAGDAYLQFFDEYNADSVKLGQTKPDFTLWLPAAGGLADPWVPPSGFRRGLVIAATSTRDGAAAPVSAVLVDLLTVALRGER